MAQKNNIWRRIKNVFSPSAKEGVSTFKPTGYEAQGYGYGENNISKKQREYLQEVQGWAGSCVTVIADELGSMSIKLYKYSKEGVEEVDEHEVLDLLYRVNDFTTKFDHFWLTQAYLDLTGESPWFLDRKGQKIVGIYFLKPDRITPITDKDKLIAGYKYDIGQGKTVTLQPEEVIFLKYPDPSNPFRGKGTMSMAARSIDIDNYSEDWNINFYKNSARPDSILSVDTEQMSDEQKDELKASIKKLHQGTDKAHNLMVLFGDMKFEKAGFSQKDMDFLEQSKFIRDKILGIFRVPKSVVSQTDGVNFASAQAGQYIFARYCIKPKMERLVQQLNEFLLPNFPGTENMFLDYDSPVPDDEETKSRITTEGVKAGIYTINEARQKYGLPDVENGDEVYLPMNVAPLSIDRTPQDTSGGKETPVKSLKLKLKITDKKKLLAEIHKDRIREMRSRSKVYFKIQNVREEYKAEIKKAIWEQYKSNEKSEKEDENRVHWTEEQVKSFWKKKNDIFLSFVPKMQKKMIDLFREQRKKTLPKFSKHKAFKLDSETVYNDVRLHVIKETEITLGLTLPILEELFEDAGNETLVALGLDMTMDTSRAEVSKLIKAEGRKFASNVTKTTNSKIRKAIVDGLANSEDMVQIEKRVRTIFVQAEEKRAVAIARTETLKYNTRATEQAFKDSEIVEGKRWITNPKPCPECSTLEGKTAPLDGNFLSKGGSVNGIVFDYEDIPTPPLHANCECDIEPVFIPTKTVQKPKVKKPTQKELDLKAKEKELERRSVELDDKADKTDKELSEAEDLKLNLKELRDNLIETINEKQDER